jgi:hypothetical protein
MFRVLLMVAGATGIVFGVGRLVDKFRYFVLLLRSPPLNTPDFIFARLLKIHS